MSGGAVTAARLLLLRARAGVALAKSSSVPQLRPLYVYRKLLNAAEVIRWAKGAGIPTTLPADNMHVTVLYSKRPVDWMAMPAAWGFEDNGGLVINPGGPRQLEVFEHGEDRACVLRFRAWEIENHNREMMDAGGSSDFPDYKPHVTLTYKLPAGFDLSTVQPYSGALKFGPAIFEAIKAGGFDTDSIMEKRK